MDAAHPQPEQHPTLRRAQIYLSETQLRNMLGLAADEDLRSIRYDPVKNSLSFIVQSPRLPMQGYRWGDEFVLSYDVEPPFVQLPLSDHYETVEQSPA